MHRVCQSQLGCVHPPTHPPCVGLCPPAPPTLQSWPNQNKREEVERIKVAVLEQLQQLQGAPGGRQTCMCWAESSWSAAALLPCSDIVSGLC